MRPRQLTGTCTEQVDELRIAARRSREQERFRKLGPGRLRNIGADIAGLKLQLDEKKAQEDCERERQKRSDEEDEAIRKYLIQIDSEDAHMKRKEVLTLENDWKLQCAQRQRARENDNRERTVGIQPETCSVGAAQQFDGEDTMKAERLRLQALQTKSWIAHQLCDKQAQQDENWRQDSEYANYIVQIERLQSEMQQADDKERARIALELQRYNNLMVEKKKLLENQSLELEKSLEAHEVKMQMDRREEYGVSSLGNRLDHWKGFSVADTRAFLAQNQSILAYKAKEQANQLHERQQERQQQESWNRELISREYEMQLKKAQIESDIQQTLETQAHEASEREKRQANRSQGAFDPSFFQAFGRSYR
uniref:Uncharacterized protein AlNc14C202G8723 n=1 Tax=Albugo laibachii Nc14 TaxID=890382 RepID=F0WQR3_9STRA|nr:conserved hypothetical protein [Albugo laibachii Nc14]CCA25333.1 conserved hypothetical protein [Albugo laibachii Nc14]|eukprot:CCA25333.1 conserved hypothetical protein [Albugo laibachii Nc14]